MTRTLVFGGARSGKSAYAERLAIPRASESGQEVVYIATASAAHLWRAYATMRAVRADNLFTLDGNLLNRAGPRMIAGAAALCEKLDIARQRRNIQ